MICPNCQANIADDSTFCTECGIQTRPTSPSDTPVDTDQLAGDDNEGRKKLVNALCVVVGLAFLIFAFIVMQSISVRNALQGEWHRADDNYVVLEFDDDDIEYRFESIYYYLNTTFFNGKFKVVSPHKIKIDRSGRGYKNYRIEMRNGNFVIRPALTSTDYSEVWFKS